MIVHENITGAFRFERPLNHRAKSAAGGGNHFFKSIVGLKELKRLVACAAGAHHGAGLGERKVKMVKEIELVVKRRSARPAIHDGSNTHGL